MSIETPPRPIATPEEEDGQFSLMDEQGNIHDHLRESPSSTDSHENEQKQLQPYNIGDSVSVLRNTYDKNGRLLDTDEIASEQLENGWKIDAVYGDLVEVVLENGKTWDGREGRLRKVVTTEDLTKWAAAAEAEKESSKEEDLSEIAAGLFENKSENESETEETAGEDEEKNFNSRIARAIDRTADVIYKVYEKAYDFAGRYEEEGPRAMARSFLRRVGSIGARYVDRVNRVATSEFTDHQLEQNIQNHDREKPAEDTKGIAGRTADKIRAGIDELDRRAKADAGKAPLFDWLKERQISAKERRAARAAKNHERRLLKNEQKAERQAERDQRAQEKRDKEALDYIDFVKKKAKYEEAKREYKQAKKNR